MERYTHKIAIRNQWIKSLNNDQVTFSYKDYRHVNVQRIMSLSDHEFIRRFSLHPAERDKLYCPKDSSE